MYNRWITLTQFRGGQVTAYFNRIGQTWGGVDRYALVEVKDGKDTYIVTGLYAPDNKEPIYYVMETPDQIRLLVSQLRA